MNRDTMVGWVPSTRSPEFTAAMTDFLAQVAATASATADASPPLEKSR